MEEQWFTLKGYNISLCSHITTFCLRLSLCLKLLPFYDLSSLFLNFSPPARISSWLQALWGEIALLSSFLSL